MAAKPRFDGEWVKVSEVFNLQMGKTPSRKNPSYWNNGDHDWVSIKDLGSYGRYVGHTKETISELGRMESGIKPVPAGTLLMSFKLSLGKTAITTKQTYTNEAIMAFLDKGCYQFDLGYMWHQFRSKDWTEGTNIAVMGKTLNKQTLGKAMIRLPELREQENISTLLDKAQEQLAIAETMQVKLDTLVKSRFVEMFGDSDSIEEKWVLKALIGCVDSIESGRSPKCQAIARKGKEPGVLKLSALSSGVFLPDENKAMCVGEKVVPSKEVMRGDILIARKNTPELVGACVIVRDEVSNLMFPDIVFRMHPKDDINGDYLLALLSSPSFSRKVKSLAHGSNKSMSNIPKSELASILIPVPPLSLQQEFADFIEQVDKSRFVVRLLVGKYNDAMTAIENFITRQGG